MKNLFWPFDTEGNFIEILNRVKYECNSLNLGFSFVFNVFSLHHDDCYIYISCFFESHCRLGSLSLYCIKYDRANGDILFHSKLDNRSTKSIEYLTYNKIKTLDELKETLIEQNKSPIIEEYVKKHKELSDENT